MIIKYSSFDFSYYRKGKIKFLNSCKYKPAEPVDNIPLDRMKRISNLEIDNYDIESLYEHWNTNAHSIKQELELQYKVIIKIQYPGFGS